MLDSTEDNAETQEESSPNAPLLQLPIIHTNEEEEEEEEDATTPTVEIKENVAPTTDSPGKPHFMSMVYLRSASMFWGCGEPCGYTLACTPDRMQQNFSIFYLNYLQLTAILIVLTLLISPSAILGMILIGLLWHGVIYCLKNDETKLKWGVIGLGFVTFFILFYLLSSIFWWTLFLGGISIILHASLRDPSKFVRVKDQALPITAQ